MNDEPRNDGGWLADETVGVTKQTKPPRPVPEVPIARPVPEAEPATVPPTVLTAETDLRPVEGPNYAELFREATSGGAEAGESDHLLEQACIDRHPSSGGDQDSELVTAHSDGHPQVGEFTGASARRRRRWH